MMWAPQNFLLYNGTIIKIKLNEWINNYKKICFVSPPAPLGMHTTCKSYENLISKKEKTISIPVKLQSCKCERNQSNAFQMIFWFQNFFVKNEKNR